MNRYKFTKAKKLKHADFATKPGQRVKLNMEALEKYLRERNSPEDELQEARDLIGTLIKYDHPMWDIQWDDGRNMPAPTGALKVIYE